MEHLSLAMEQQNQHQEQHQVEWRRDKVRALQQRIQPKRDIANTANWISYSK
jgi:hypothetical protein